jgi:hypothetical protein
MIRGIAVCVFLFGGITVLAAGDPPAEPKKDKDAVDVGKTAERIVQNANEAGKRLGAKDPGEETRKIQREILKDIDALIRKAKEPPPDEQNMGGGTSNAGGMSKNDGGTSQQSKGSNTPSGGPPSRKERRERARQNAGNSGGVARQPQPMSEPSRPEAKNGAGLSDSSPNRIGAKTAMPRIPDIYKEVWGHLPEKMRQEMDLYFRDQFMPRYSELLRQYYSSLAERPGKNGP